MRSQVAELLYVIPSWHLRGCFAPKLALAKSEKKSLFFKWQKKKIIQSSPTNKRRKLNCYSDQSNPKYALLQQSFTSSPCWLGLIASAQKWKAVQRLRLDLPGSHYISAALLLSMSLFWIYIPLRHQNQTAGSSFPQKYKIRGPKSVLRCKNADKEKLCSESYQLHGRVNVVVTEIRDLLWCLCRSHLLDLGCFWVLPYPTCWVLSAETEGNTESATKCVPSCQNPRCMLQLQLLLALPLAIFSVAGSPAAPQTLSACHHCIFKIKSSGPQRLCAVSSLPGGP